MSDHFRGSFSLANKTPHAFSSSKSINIDTIVTILETILLFENLLFLYTENIKFELTPMGLIVYRRKKYGKEIESFTG